MKSDKRVERNQAAIFATRKILREIITSPEQFSEDGKLITALKSQGGVAKLEYELVINEDRVNKNPVSLNTFKSYADQTLDGGFEGLDNLRRAAAESIEGFLARSNRPDSRSRLGLQSKIKELEEELDKHRSINYILLQAIQSSISSINSVRDAGDDQDLREKRAKDGLARLRAVIRLNPAPFGDVAKKSTVVSLKDYKNEK